MKKTKIDIAVGRVMYRARADREWTQADLAKQMKLSYQQIQKYESGINRLSVARLFDLAKVLDTTPGSLVERVRRQLEKDTNHASKRIKQP